MTSTFVLPRTLRIAGIALGAVALAGTGAFATVSAAGNGFHLGEQPAGAATKSGGASAVCDDFMGHFAANLGTDQSKVNSAFQQAIAQTLADQVKAGKLTQQEADALKSRLGTKPPCTVATELRPNRALLPFFSQQLVSAAASALDLTPDQLKADLKKGMSLSQIAAAHNPPITEAQFRAKVLAALKPQLDQMVKDGKLTAAQEQKIVDRIENGPIPFWDKAPVHRAALTPAQSA